MGVLLVNRGSRFRGFTAEGEKVLDWARRIVGDARAMRAEINAADIPAISDEIFALIARGCVPGGTEQNLKTARALTRWGKTNRRQRLLLTDAQTSGGLLLAVSPRRLNAVLQLLTEWQTPSCAVIGKISSSRKQLISVSTP
jgi:selenophosphate synthase